jgi:Protein kinase domain
MATPEVGSQFAGYRIESLVGRGGMGVVYRATQLDLGRTVALKLIAPEALEDDASRARFVSEARHAAAIEHPHVVPIYAAGEADGTAYFVMRFVEGDDLRTRVRRDGPLAPLHAAQILESAAAALDAIHAAGLVHRDVKPANILLAAGDHVYLTDFGLARMALARESTAGSGRWAGSLHYAAPEQIRGGRVDARADVYALGGVLVFMLTSRVPFDRDSDEATLWAHVADPPPRPAEMRRGLPKAFDEVVSRAMAKSPDDRYASAGDLGRAALAAAQGRREPRRRGAVAQGAASPAGAVALPGMSDEAPTLTAATVGAPPRRRRGVLAGAAVAAVALAAGAIALLAPGGAKDGRAVLAGTRTPAPTTSATPTATPTPTPHVARTFRHVSNRPNDIEIVGDQLWVTSAHVSLVHLDAMTGRRRSRDLTVPAGGKAISAHGDRVWVSNTRERMLFAMDAISHRVLERVPQPGPAIAIAADETGGVWVAIRGPRNRPPDTVIHYDATGRPLWQRTIPHGVNAIVLGPQALWVAETLVPKLMRIDRLTGRASARTRLISEAGALAYGGGYVWASLPTDGSVARVNTRTDRSIPATAGERPSQLAYTAGRVFVACMNDQKLVVIDPKSLQRTGRLDMPFNPFAVTADARHVWVAGLGEDTVTRVDLD